jgi:hypothetical protein
VLVVAVAAAVVGDAGAIGVGDGEHVAAATVIARAVVVARYLVFDVGVGVVVAAISYA